MYLTEQQVIDLIGLGAQQTEVELRWFLNRMREIKPEKILEIGTGCGVFTCMLAIDGALVITIDNRVNVKGHWELPKYEEAGIDLNVIQIRADSQLQAVADLVRDEYDLVVIDGDHSWAGGLRDWELYVPMGEVIALHDMGQYKDEAFHAKDCDWFPTRKWWEIKHAKRKPVSMRTDEIAKERYDQILGGWGIVYK
jgi:hypothetical protein